MLQFIKSSVEVVETPIVKIPAGAAKQTCSTRVKITDKELAECIILEGCETKEDGFKPKVPTWMGMVYFIEGGDLYLSDCKYCLNDAATAVLYRLEKKIVKARFESVEE